MTVSYQPVSLRKSGSRILYVPSLKNSSHSVQRLAGSLADCAVVFDWIHSDTLATKWQHAIHNSCTGNESEHKFS